EIAYVPGAALPSEDRISVVDDTPSALSVWSEDAGPLPARMIGDHTIAVRLAASATPPRRVRVRFEQPAPAHLRYGWRYAYGTLDWGRYAFRVEGSVATTVVVPAGEALPDFECAPEGGDLACARATPQYIPA